MTSKRTEKPSGKTSKAAGKLAQVAHIARPNQCGIVRDGVLYLIETKVTDAYREAFPDATATKLVVYDLATSGKPRRAGELVVYASWGIAAAEPGNSAVYLAAVRRTEGDPKDPVMDVLAIDVRDPAAPKLAATVAIGAKYVADSRNPILVAAGTRLVFGSRADATLHVLDTSSPLSPRVVATVELPDRPEAAAPDRDAVIVTRLGGPMLALGGSDWTNLRTTTLPGYQPPARVGDRYFLADGTSLAWTDAAGKRLGATKKLGPTSIHVYADGERAITLGDHLAVWSTDGDEPAVIAKAKLEGQPNRVTASGGFICLPHVPDAKAADKRKAFGFSVWAVA